MDVVAAILVMLLGVVASNWIVRACPVPVALPLVQIAIGAGIGSITDLSVQLDPELFFILFLPPLLFLDGWRVPREDFRRDIGTILSLAFGLSIFTIIGVGLLLSWLVPTMPIAVSFALAAVLSPTDVVAAKAIRRHVPMPKRLLRILEGEALLNDAVGLVCLRFAIAAAMTGHFSVPGAFIAFIWLALGGVSIGVATTWTILKFKDFVALRLGEDTASQILISLLIPFAAYLAADRLGCSGILAAVAAGLTMGRFEIGGQALAVTRIRRSAVWDMVQFSLNGVIFVLLGEQLPGIAAGAVMTVRESGHQNVWWLAIDVAALVVALAILRFIWVWTSVKFSLFYRRRHTHRTEGPRLRLVAAMSIAGVRGSITLAGVLALPLALPDGTAFPARDLAIFLAAGVIVVSLIIANIGMPPLLKGVKLPPEPSRQQEEDRARIGAATAAIRAIEDFQHRAGEGTSNAEYDTSVADSVMDLYRRRIDRLSNADSSAEEARRTLEAERALRLSGLKAERDTVLRMARKNQIESELARRLLREIDLAEVRYRA